MSEILALPSGALEISANGKTVQLDILTVQLAGEVAERKHGASNGAADWFTPAFLADLAAEYQKIGVDGCTPTQAHIIRNRVAKEMNKIREDFF